MNLLKVFIFRRSFFNLIKTSDAFPFRKINENMTLNIIYREVKNGI